MKFTNRVKRVVPESRVLSVLDLKSLKDIKTEDIKVLIDRGILPILSRDERENLLEGTISFWINDDFEHATLVGFMRIESVTASSLRELSSGLHKKYGPLDVEKW